MNTNNIVAAKVLSKWTTYRVSYNNMTFQGHGRIWEETFEYSALEEYWDKELIDKLEQTVKDYEVQNQGKEES